MEALKKSFEKDFLKKFLQVYSSKASIPYQPILVSDQRGAIHLKLHKTWRQLLVRRFMQTLTILYTIFLVVNMKIHLQAYIQSQNLFDLSFHGIWSAVYVCVLALQGHIEINMKEIGVLANSLDLLTKTMEEKYCQPKFATVRRKLSAILLFVALYSYFIISTATVFFTFLHNRNWYIYSLFPVSQEATGKVLGVDPQKNGASASSPCS
ncbi:unnamed protein product [Orchesella dallaii]|uniref:Uncharacterized protein n=1 Tax=Orchesella dallaii TaxID=48710 RepID=A0ABP1RCV4_9HEXA